MSEENSKNLFKFIKPSFRAKSIPKTEYERERLSLICYIPGPSPEEEVKLFTSTTDVTSEPDKDMVFIMYKAAKYLSNFSMLFTGKPLNVHDVMVYIESTL